MIDFRESQDRKFVTEGNSRISSGSIGNDPECNFLMFEDGPEGRFVSISPREITIVQVGIDERIVELEHSFGI